MNSGLREFMFELAKNLDKIIDDGVKADNDLWFTYNTHDNEVDINIFCKHKLGYTLYFSGQLDTEYITISYQKMESNYCDVLYVTILLKENIGITHLNTHIQAIANLIKSLIEM